MALVVSRATILEWPQIEFLARSYYAELGRDYQDRKESSEWYVARSGERVYGCYATKIFPDVEQLWITDLYRNETYAGARSISLMFRHAYDRADDLGYAVGFMVDPENRLWLRPLKRYGGATCVGLIYLRKPQ